MHDARRQRMWLRLRRLVATLILGMFLIDTLAVGASTAAAPEPLREPVARAVPKQDCRAIDPNLVNGVCLMVNGSLTWIGSFRADNGRVFFCIDFLYDSRLPGGDTRSTQNLVNQLGDKVGEREVAALNFIISTWAGRGSTGSDSRDAAIALIIREVMGDGRRGDGSVVYPAGLRVGERVKPPTGGAPDAVMSKAQAMWSQASREYGDWRLQLDATSTKALPLGKTRRWKVSVRSASGQLVPDVMVELTCTGPITCPERVRSARKPVDITVTPRELGRFTIRVSAEGPSSDGRLYQLDSWSTHGGRNAANAGHQRGWIAEEATLKAHDAATSRVVKATPEIDTVASAATAMPGDELFDNVTITGLPEGSSQTATATLFGPYTTQPSAENCVADEAAGEVAGEVMFEVASDGTFTTDPVMVHEPGYYTWVVSMPGDALTHPVRTACGIVAESTRVRFAPTYTTQISDQVIEAGGAVSDTVMVGGLGASESLDIAWELYGPAERLEDITCTEEPFASGVVTALGDGPVITPEVTLSTPGVYTYLQHHPESDRVEAHTTTCGELVETVVVTEATPPVVASTAPPTDPPSESTPVVPTRPYVPAGGEADANLLRFPTPWIVLVGVVLVGVGGTLALRRRG